MVKMALQIKATLERIEELKTNHPDYPFVLRLKCLNCGELSDKWHDITESHTFPTRIGKSETHFIARCKLCGRENSLDIVAGSNDCYTAEDQGDFKTIVIFDCRGIEPIDFTPGEGWIAKGAENGTLFANIDLKEREWADYDEKQKESVGVYEFEAQFVKVK